MTHHVLGLRCTICGAEYRVGEVDYVCPRHGHDGILDVLYDYARIRREVAPERLTTSPDRSIWRYLPLMPVDADLTRSLAEGTVLGSVGWTPLFPAPRLAARLGLKHLWVKDDSRQPTASFKDRASAVAVVAVEEAQPAAAVQGQRTRACGGQGPKRQHQEERRVGEGMPHRPQAGVPHLPEADERSDRRGDLALRPAPAVRRPGCSRDRPAVRCPAGRRGSGGLGQNRVQGRLRRCG